MPLSYVQKQSMNWCREQFNSNQKQLEMLDSGKMHTGENRGNGWVDTTQADIAAIQKRSDGLMRLIQQFEQLDA